MACNKRLGLTYVSDSINGCIYGFDKHGKHIFTFGTTNGEQKGNGGLVCPLGMDIAADDNVYVADKGTGVGDGVPGAGRRSARAPGPHPGGWAAGSRGCERRAAGTDRRGSRKPSTLVPIHSP